MNKYHRHFDHYIFNVLTLRRLLNACWEMPNILAATDWLPLARFIASSTSNCVACFMWGNSVQEVKIAFLSPTGSLGRVLSSF